MQPPEAREVDPGPLQFTAHLYGYSNQPTLSNGLASSADVSAHWPNSETSSSDSYTPHTLRFLTWKVSLLLIEDNPSSQVTSRLHKKKQDFNKERNAVQSEDFLSYVFWYVTSIIFVVCNYISGMLHRFSTLPSSISVM